MKFKHLLIGEYFTLPNSYAIYQKTDSGLNKGYTDKEVWPATGIKSSLHDDEEVIAVDHQWFNEHIPFDDYNDGDSCL